MKHLNEEKIYRLINKIEKSMFYGDIFSCKVDTTDIFALHEALMLLQQLVKQGFIEFDDEGFVIINANGKNRTE